MAIATFVTQYVLQVIQRNGNYEELIRILSMAKYYELYHCYICKTLFVTSENTHETMSSPIHEIKVLRNVFFRIIKKNTENVF